MPNFSFRLRFQRSPTDTLMIDSPRWESQPIAERPAVVLCCNPDETAIKDSTTWAFKSEGWPSEEEAAHAAAKFVPAFAATLARLRVGGRLWRSGPEIWVFPSRLGNARTAERLSCLKRRSWPDAL